MLLKEILKEKIADCGLSNKEVAHSIGVTAPLISQYLSGSKPSESKLIALSELLHFNVDEIDKAPNLSISVEEAATLMGKPVLYVRNAIKRGQLPGSFVEANAHTTFHIPRYAFYKYLGIEPPKEGVRNEERMESII